MKNFEVEIIFSPSLRQLETVDTNIFVSNAKLSFIHTEEDLILYQIQPDDFFTLNKGQHYRALALKLFNLIPEKYGQKDYNLLNAEEIEEYDRNLANYLECLDVCVQIYFKDLPNQHDEICARIEYLKQNHNNKPALQLELIRLSNKKFLIQEEVNDIALKEKTETGDIWLYVLFLMARSDLRYIEEEYKKMELLFLIPLYGKATIKENYDDIKKQFETLNLLSSLSEDEKVRPHLIEISIPPLRDLLDMHYTHYLDRIFIMQNCRIIEVRDTELWCN
jgi:hypothetical protein